MNTRLKLHIKSIVVATAFVAIGCAWWYDHQLLSERLLKEQQKVVRATQQNAVLRQSVMTGRTDLDRLFAHTVVQQDAIKQLKALSDGLRQRLNLSQ